MRLVDAAKAARQRTSSSGYAFLRELREMGEKTYGKESLRVKWDELMAFEKTPEALTLEGMTKVFRLSAELQEGKEIGAYCRKVVASAEKAERQKRGAAEKIDREKVKAEITAIREKWRMQKNLQITLEDIGEDGGAGECDNEGS